MKRQFLSIFTIAIRGLSENIAWDIGHDMNSPEGANTANTFSVGGVINNVTSLLKKEAGLVYTAIGNMGAAVLGGLFWFILAGLLPVDSYGLLNYYIAIANIFLRHRSFRHGRHSNHFPSKRRKNGSLPSNFPYFNLRDSNCGNSIGL
jgi:hypothetical protein